MDLATVAIIFAALIGLLEILSILVVRHDINSYKGELEGKGSIGDQLEEWLMREEDTEGGGKVKVIEAIGALMGRAMYQSQHMSGLQEKSVEARLENRYTKEVQEAVKKKMPIGWKILLRVADELGFNLEEILEKGELAEFAAALQNNNVDLLMGMQGGDGPVSHQRGVKR